MPTFSSISLDRLLQPIKRNMTTVTTTTENTIHLSDSSSFSFPPSPPPLGGRDGSSDASFSFPPLRGVEEAAAVQNWRNGNGRDAVVRTYDKSNGCQNGRIGNIRLDGNGNGDSSPRLVPSSPDTGDFFDPHESLSVTSSVEAEGSVGGDRSSRWSAPGAEFYDAYEELSEGGSQSQSFLCDVEAELREKRLSWLMEMDGRKQAEEALETMKRQWERLALKLLLEGLTLPSASTVAAVDDKLEIDPAEELCEQIRLARVVSTFVGSTVGKGAAELELESKIESKNFEISRLLQRLKYYEAINHEMSQKNQEAVDMERRLNRRRKRRRQRWIWGAVGASVVFGSAALACSFLPTASGSHPNDSFEVDSAAK